MFITAINLPLNASCLWANKYLADKNLCNKNGENNGKRELIRPAMLPVVAPKYIIAMSSTTAELFTQKVALFSFVLLDVSVFIEGLNTLYRQQFYEYFYNFQSFNCYQAAIPSTNKNY